MTTSSRMDSLRGSDPQRGKQRIVLIQGAFEILNYGHIRAFEFARAQGDWLVVALNSNELIREYKGRVAVVPWRQKRLIIESLRCVDEVVKATEFSPLKLLKKLHVDVYVLSREWESTKAAEIAYVRERGGRVCFSRRYAGISTTLIKERLLREHMDVGDSGRYNGYAKPTVREVGDPSPF